jgi:hypothetical protein
MLAAALAGREADVARVPGRARLVDELVLTVHFTGTHSCLDFRASLAYLGHVSVYIVDTASAFQLVNRTANGCRKSRDRSSLPRGFEHASEVRQAVRQTDIRQLDETTDGSKL